MIGNFKTGHAFTWCNGSTGWWQDGHITSSSEQVQFNQHVFSTGKMSFICHEFYMYSVGGKKVVIIVYFTDYY